MSTLAPPVSLRASRFAGVGPAGVILAALWVVAIAGLAYLLVQALDPSLLERYGWRFLAGFWTTIQLVAISVIVGALISLPIAAGRLSPRNWARGLSFAYSYFFRGTPLLAQLFLVYYGVGQFSGFFKAVGLWWFFRDAFLCTVLCFALNTAAYQAEILAGAIRAIPRGQWEGGAALGMHTFATLWKVVLPQSLVTALRPYGNEVILMIKASAVASIVTVLDLMGQTRFIFSKTYDLSVYLWAAVFYLASVWVLSRIVNLLERRITRHLKARTA